MIVSTLLALPLLAAPGAGDVVAVQAGTMHLVEGGAVIEDGTLLVRDGKIVAVGTDVEVPAGARVVDYGDDAVIVPGLVAADSAYGGGPPADRTASPTLRALDHFNPYTNLWEAVRDGVTAVYIPPARGRLIAGQGAVVKTYGDPDRDRVLAAGAVLHGSIAAEARRTPGYWEPPVPATVDVGLGVERPQLPRTTMGAVMALSELLALVGGDEALVEEYGLETGPALAAWIESGRPWRMGADSAEEVRALLGVFGPAGIPLVLDGAPGAVELAEEVAAAGVPVITGPRHRGTADFGKDPEDWPRHDVASALAKAGVRVAIAAPTNGALRFTAALAMRGGLAPEEALRAITLTPAEVLGVADRVGSLAPGKDADFVVLNGAPLDATTGVVATWVDGELAWKPKSSEATVIEVDELFVGDGAVLRPGQLLLVGGRIVEVGPRVAHPAGATVVRGAAAMPGVIDALGHLGLEGSRKSFSTRFDLTRIVEPGDEVDRRVAQAGVTTVNLGSPTMSGESPTMAYKPAATDHRRQVVAHPAALRVEWTEDNRTTSGDDVRKLLQKAAEYKQKWEEYEKAIAEWTPPAEEAGAEEKKDEAEEPEEADEDEKEPAAPVTGEWQGSAEMEEGELELRLRLLERDLHLEGTLHVEGRTEVVVVSGQREEYAVALAGHPAFGQVALLLELEKGKLEGTLHLGATAAEVELERTSDAYPVARRLERRKPESEKEPKGKPRAPGIDPELEPLRQAMFGDGAVIVSVAREDEILACVAEFEKYGIRPILWEATGVEKVAGQLRGRVAGVLTRGPVAALARAGIPVAFYSAAEEGAAELPTAAAYAVSRGLGPEAALRALTAGAADMLSIEERVGRLASGLDADVLLLDGSPLDVSSRVLRVWVDGEEVR